MQDVTLTISKPARTEFLKKQFFQHKPAICLEGALAKTEAFKEFSYKPLIVKRALGIKKTCETKTIVIESAELIVGSSGCRPRTAVICPELSNHWIPKELDTMASRSQDPYEVTEEQKKIYLEQIYPFWEGKTLYEKWLGLAPQDVLDLLSLNGVIDNDNHLLCGPGETVPEFPDYILPKGFAGIQQEAQELYDNADLTKVENYDKKAFWESSIIICEGLRILCRRHAEKAKELAQSENDVQRKAELEQIAFDCAYIADNPPETLRQALQVIHFVFMGLFMESNSAFSYGRMDQYLYPYYKHDIDNGILDNEKVLELLEAFWIKTNDAIWYWHEAGIRHFAGYCAFQNIQVGGLNRVTGLDGVNELSYLMLQASIDTKMIQPSISVGLSKKNPEDFYLKICELVKEGTGFPSVYNDEVGQKMLMNKGVPLDKALDWCCIGCVEPVLPGKGHQWSSTGHINLGAVIEFALNNGIHRKTGKQGGLATGDPVTFKTYEDFKKAVYDQLDYLIEEFCKSQNLIELLNQKYLPNPLSSTFILDCVKNGKDLMHGGARYLMGPGMNINGLADFADSMIAVKKAVYDEKLVSMQDLLQALANDFVGYEHIERILIKDCPKWGNDKPEADAMAIELCNFLTERYATITGLLGTRKLPCLYPVSSNVPQGMAVGALPSGRKAWKPLADGCSASQGLDENGPTAILRSLGKIPHASMDGGTLLNIWLTPTILDDKNGFKNLSAFLKSFLDLGVFHVQFNMVNQKLLRCAQKNPDDYKSLLVRVAGYSAYFVDLSKEVQNDILSRTVNDL